MKPTHVSHTTAQSIINLLNSGNFTENKPQLISGFTRGRTTDLNQMFEWEAAGLLKWLQDLLVENQA